VFQDEWYWAVCIEADCLYTLTHRRYVNATSLNVQQPFDWGIMRDNEWKEQTRKHMKWRSDKSKWWVSAVWGDAILFPIHRCWKIRNKPVVLFALKSQNKVIWDLTVTDLHDGGVYQQWWSDISLPTFCIQECSATGCMLSSVRSELSVRTYTYNQASKMYGM
jgi:hypothetical protein